MHRNSSLARKHWADLIWRLCLPCSGSSALNVSRFRATTTCARELTIGRFVLRVANITSPHSLGLALKSEFWLVSRILETKSKAFPAIPAIFSIHLGPSSRSAERGKHAGSSLHPFTTYNRGHTSGSFGSESKPRARSPVRTSLLHILETRGLLHIPGRAISRSYKGLRIPVVLEGLSPGARLLHTPCRVRSVCGPRPC